MGAEKFSASMDARLLEQVRADAEARGLSLSSWLTEAAAERLRIHALRNLLDEWEAEHGAITPGEMEALGTKLDAATQPGRRSSRGRAAS